MEQILELIVADAVVKFKAKKEIRSFREIIKVCNSRQVSPVN